MERPMDAELIALKTDSYYYLTPDGDGSGSLERSAADWAAQE